MPDIITFRAVTAPKIGTGQTTFYNTEHITPELEEEGVLFEGKEIRFKEYFPYNRNLMCRIDETYQNWQDLLGLKSNATREEAEAELEKMKAKPENSGYTYRWEKRWRGLCD